MANQSLQKAEPKFSAVISSESYTKLINSTLHDPKRAARFVASVTSAVSANPALQKCKASTIVSSALLGESLNLSPSPSLGQYYMVPFEDRKNDRTVATFQLGYRGYIQLAMRSGEYADIDVIEVREGEYTGRNKLSGKPTFSFIENDDERERLPVVGYLAYFETLNGFEKRIYWSVEKMLNHADRYSEAFSKDGKIVHTKNGDKKKVSFKDFQEGKYDKNDSWLYSSPWYSSFDGMAKKTMLRQLLSKWGIMSIEMQDAFTSDQAVIGDHGEPEYVDSVGEDDAITVTPAKPEEPTVEITETEKEELDFFNEEEN